MEEARGVVKHVLLGRFKDDVTPELQEELIRGYAGLVPLIEPMKAFHCDWDVSMESWNQGLTHVFKSIFEIIKCVIKYFAHPAHVEFVNKFLLALAKRGRDVSIENLHQGFTHVFESTFESIEGIAEYVAHPAHVEFANLLLPKLEKFIVIDYKPTIIQL